MRKVVVYELLSLDGVAEAPDFFFTDWDDMMQANLAAVIAAQDAVILGRRSYGEWAEFGRRLLDGLPSIQLESIRSSTSPSGYLLVDYRLIR